MKEKTNKINHKAKIKPLNYKKKRRERKESVKSTEKKTAKKTKKNI